MWVAISWIVREARASPSVAWAIALGNTHRPSALLLSRRTAGAFADQEIALAESFRDQAAIAIENTRLFNETTEALDQQRASSEVLASISNSIADAQPVFDVIMQRCQHLFAGENVGVTLVRDDGMLDIGAYTGAGGEELRRLYPQPLDRTSASGQAIVDRKVLMYADIEVDDIPARSRNGCRAIGLRSMIFAPMLSEGRAVGTLWVGRAATGGFTEKQVALLKTFAEQAVIAIQNARLFNETREALEQQTATAEILRVISGSMTDVRPVFDAIVASCQRLFDGVATNLLLASADGKTLNRVAVAAAGGLSSARGIDSWPLDHDSVSGDCVLGSRIVVVNDREQVFERFHSLRPSEEDFGSHSGLGLAIARTIAEAHDGTLKATDRRDGQGGARLVLDLPAVADEEVEA